jgi:hypothetical protein
VCRQSRSLAFWLYQAKSRSCIPESLLAGPARVELGIGPCERVRKPQSASVPLQRDSRTNLNDVMATAAKGPNEGTLSASFSMHAKDLVVLYASPELEYVAAVPPVTFPPIYSLSDMSGPAGRTEYAEGGRFQVRSDGLTTRVAGPKRIGMRVDPDSVALGPGDQPTAWERALLLNISVFPASSPTFWQSQNPTPRLEIELFNDSGDIVAQARIPVQETGTIPFVSYNANAYGMVMLQGNGPTIYDASVPAVYVISLLEMAIIG